VNYPHCIRLRGPWECEPLVAHADRPPPARRITVPLCLGDLGLLEPAGLFRLTRRFGYPGRIDSYEHVWLTLAALMGCAGVALNGQTLTGAGAGDMEFEVTSLLAPHNRLEVIIDAGDDRAGLGDVALEIRRDAFLRDVRARREVGGTVRVTGMVVGSSSLPLELYALAGGQQVCYCRTEAQPCGQPFELSFSADARFDQVRIELVCVAERWYAADVMIENLPAG
jgi:hypothetical protein